MKDALLDCSSNLMYSNAHLNTVMTIARIFLEMSDSRATQGVSLKKLLAQTHGIPHAQNFLPRTPMETLEWSDIRLASEEILNNRILDTLSYFFICWQCNVCCMVIKR